MKTFLAKTGEIERKWAIVDATEAPIGRLAVLIANALRGKDEPTYTPHVDTGKFVVVINADKAFFTGSKETSKVYVNYSGWRSGYRETKAQDVRAKNSERLLRDAVWGMMPHGRLGRAQFGKLKIYPGAEHPHAAQKPEKLSL